MDVNSDRGSTAPHLDLILIHIRQLEPKSPAQSPSVSRPIYTRQLEPKSPAQSPSVSRFWVGIARRKVISFVFLNYSPPFSVGLLDFKERSGPSPSSSP